MRSKMRRSEKRVRLMKKQNNSEVMIKKCKIQKQSRIKQNKVK